MKMYSVRKSSITSTQDLFLHYERKVTESISRQQAQLNVVRQLIELYVYPLSCYISLTFPHLQNWKAVL